jgi:membrane fusion protein (multidrug efflux system)
LNAQLANLAAAQATAQNNRVAAERARSIADKGLMSKTDMDNAEAAERTSAAAVKQAQANVEAARINLGYASVRAPISGRAGQQQVTEGALVGQGEATLLATIEQIDPIYANFSQAVGDLDQLQRAQASGDVTLDGRNQARVELTLPDGTAYGEAGTLDFSGTTVDAATGAVSLRGTIPNAGHKLLPGMYVSVRVTFGELKHAFLVPQAAVQRDGKGAFVYVVGADNKVAQKRITADRQQGDAWIVTDGIADGDRIVVSGVQRVRPEAPAKPVPWTPNADPSAPAAPKKADEKAPAKN